MALTEEQVTQIKAQLLRQIESFPPEQKDAAKQEIEEMTAEELEQFLIKNNLIKGGGELEANKESSPEDRGQECVFCMIRDGKVPSYKIEENKKAMAILEINPLSYGHSLVISKEHDSLPNQAFVLANRVGKRVKSKLKADEIKIENAKVFGHNLINIIPLFKGKKPEKKKAEEKELILLQDKLKAKPKSKKEKKAEEKKEAKTLIAPRRIP